MGRFIADYEDVKAAELWERGTSEEPLDLTHIADMAVIGVSQCEEHCSSRQVCGEDRCICIRDAFPTPEHYQLYLLMRRQYTELLSLGIASTAFEEKKMET